MTDVGEIEPTVSLTSLDHNHNVTLPEDETQCLNSVSPTFDQPTLEQTVSGPTLKPNSELQTNSENQTNSEIQNLISKLNISSSKPKTTLINRLKFRFQDWTDEKLDNRKLTELVSHCVDIPSNNKSLLLNPMLLFFVIIVGQLVADTLRYQSKLWFCIHFTATIFSTIKSVQPSTTSCTTGSLKKINSTADVSSDFDWSPLFDRELKSETQVKV